VGVGVGVGVGVEFGWPGFGVLVGAGAPEPTAVPETTIEAATNATKHSPSAPRARLIPTD
jgi:hypothetical protein